MNDANSILAELGEQMLDTDVDTSNNLLPATQSNSGRQGVTSTTEEKALDLLGKGIANEIVASALGVTPARITQLLADENFATEVQKRRFLNLQKNTMRDNVYDEIEDELLKKLKKSLGLIIKPDTLLKAITVINQAKRRGNTNTAAITDKTDIVQIAMPQIIKQKFVTNVNNQVIQVGERELTTMDADTLQTKLEESRNVIEERENNSGGES